MPKEPLDDAGRRDAALCPLEARFRGNIVLSPNRSALETVAAMGFDGQQDAALRDIGYGTWSGKAFETVADDGLEAWIVDPIAGVPDGEPMDSVLHRVGAWLDSMAALDRPVCGITHATVIRAILAYAISIPLRATLAIDIAPLSRTILSYNRGWRLQSLAPPAEYSPTLR